MAKRTLPEILDAPPSARPAVLAGRWLALAEDAVLAGVEPASILEGGPEALARLPGWLTRHAQAYPAGGAIGYLTYELASAFEKLPLTRFPFLPEFSFAYYPRLERFSHADLPPAPSPGYNSASVRMNFSVAEYRHAIARIMHYLAAGDIYQANLTQQFVASLQAQSCRDIFLRLAADGSPFGAFLRGPACTIISDSPERFFRVAGGSIMASPVKGTIARGHSRAEDEAVLTRLRASRKDRAENTMIVDLLRNDLGRICRYQTIEAQLFEVEPLPHLFHLVSHVRGDLRPEVGVLDIFRALFPCGSITGAPKIRAMQILTELERVPRGVSMGAIGVIRGALGREAWEMDFNVAIRTLTVHRNEAIFNVGGGIVSDSQAKSEYAELMLKAQPLFQALGVVAPDYAE